MVHPRGPTFVSVPSDDLAQPASSPAVRRIATAFETDSAAIARLATAVGKAEQPAFVVGPDVGRSGAVETMVA